MITSVSYRKSGSPQPEAGFSYNTSGTFKKSNSVEPSASCPPGPSNPSKIPSKKSGGSFWQNLFRPNRPDSIINSNEKTANGTRTGTLERSKSSETVNSICSTNSFSFVSSPGRKYKGRKKGKRIPLPDDSLSRPPQPTARQKISTLTRLGMKIGLKSKYNLQSCESLHRLNTIDLNKSTASTSSTNSLNRTIRKRKAPLPPGGVQLNRIVVRCEDISPVAATAHARAEPVPSTSTTAYAKSQVHRRCYSEGNDYSGYISPKSRYHVRGKRRAPAPPNPFGDPDAAEMPDDEPQDRASVRLSIVSENDEVSEKDQPRIRSSEPGCSKLVNAKSPRNSYVEKEVQSENEYSNHPESNSLLIHEKAVNDEVKAQLAILKSEADASALKLVKPSQGNKVKSKSVCDPSPEDIGGKRSPMETPVKIAPRPWYKRSSSKNSSANSSHNSVPPKKGPKPTMMIMAKFSDLDREASRIVEENRRRSAEISYNETAKELITMFNEFNINQQTVNADASSPTATAQTVATEGSSASTSSQVVDVRSEVPTNSTAINVPPGEKNGIPKPAASSTTPTSSVATAKIPTPEEPKKLAVVQPQSQSNPRKSSTEGQSTSIATAAPPNRLFENRVTPLPTTNLRSNNTPPISIADRVPENPEGWSCPRCTLKNDYWRSFCDACHYRNSVGSTVQSISSLFENVNRQIEVRTAHPTQNYNSPTSFGTKPSVQPETTPGISNSNRRKKSSGFPPCENFLSQLPLKEKIANEEKLEGMKLQGDPEMEELDIAKLREARVAFFEKNKPEIKPNNLTFATPIPTASSSTNMLSKENVVSECEDDYALDALLEIHQQLNPNMSGTGPQTWKPFNVQKFRPMLESIVETTNDNYYNGGYNPVYENCRIDNDNQSSTNMFMQNIQIQLQDHIRYFEQLSSGENTPEENDQFNFQENMDGRKRELTLEEYQKLGAIPKYFQNGSRAAASSSRRHSQPEESRRGSKKRSNGHSSQMNFGEPNENSTFTGDTLAISKLLRHLEWAIAQGDHRLAASLAHDLALCKVNCVVSKATQQIVIRVYVEDRLMQQGPFQVQVTPSTTVKELKAKTECDWGIPANFQKWILGRKIAEDDDQTLSFYEIVNDSMAFLYLVTPGSENENLESEQPNPENKTTTPTRVPNRTKLASPVPVNRNIVDEMPQPPRPPPPTIASEAQKKTPPIQAGYSKDLKKLPEGNSNNSAEIKRKVLTENSKTSKLLPDENRVTNQNIIETRNAQIQYGPAAEAANALPKLQKAQSAQVKLGSPELIMTKVKAEMSNVNQLIPADPKVSVQQLKAIQPVVPQNQNANATRAIDIANNNLIPSQNPTHNKIPDKSKKNKAQAQATDSKLVPKASPPEKCRRRKFFRANVPKVDQGTSIEKDSPIRGDFIPGNSTDMKCAQPKEVGLNVNHNVNELPPRLPPKNTTTPLAQNQKDSPSSIIVSNHFNSEPPLVQKTAVNVSNNSNTPIANTNTNVSKENFPPKVTLINSSSPFITKESIAVEVLTNKSPSPSAQNQPRASGVTAKNSSPLPQSQLVAPGLSPNNSAVTVIQSQTVTQEVTVKNYPFTNSQTQPLALVSSVPQNQLGASRVTTKNSSPVPQNQPGASGVAIQNPIPVVQNLSGTSGVTGKTSSPVLQNQPSTLGITGKNSSPVPQNQPSTSGVTGKNSSTVPQNQPGSSGVTIQTSYPVLPDLSGTSEVTGKTSSPVPQNLPGTSGLTGKTSSPVPQNLPGTSGVTGKNSSPVPQNLPGSSGVTGKNSSPVPQNLPGDSGVTVRNSTVVQSQPGASGVTVRNSTVLQSQPGASGVTAKNSAPVPQSQPGASEITSKKISSGVQNQIVEQGVPSNYSPVSAVLKLSVLPERLNKDSVVLDFPSAGAALQSISAKKCSVISPNEIQSEITVKNSQSPDPPDEILSPENKTKNSKSPVPVPSKESTVTNFVSTNSQTPCLSNDLTASGPAQNGSEEKIVNLKSQTPTKQKESQPTGLPPKNSIPKPSPIKDNAHIQNTTDPDTSSLRRNSAPANLRRIPPVNKPFVKSIGGIFMSRFVGNLVAAAENMNRNQQVANRPAPVPGNSRNLNSKILAAPPPVAKKLVFPDVRNKLISGAASSSGTVADEKKLDNFQTYKRMLQLMEKEDFIKTTEEVDCPVCLSRIPSGEGITLRDCLHSFCAECLVGAIQYSEEPQVRCPFRDNTYSCDSYMQEREVKGLAPADLYDRHLARSVKLAESKMSNAFHCKTNDCTGWCIYEDDVNVFNCPVCRKRNCLTCQAIHEGQDCQEHQRKMAIAAETDENAKSSRLMLEKMISRGEALDCPACHVVLLKKWGCDWVRCSYCKTEICWVTKGFRWGPNGKGDTSGGCKCGINGVRCHPKCTYCH